MPTVSTCWVTASVASPTGVSVARPTAAPAAAASAVSRTAMPVAVSQPKKAGADLDAAVLRLLPLQHGLPAGDGCVSRPRPVVPGVRGVRPGVVARGVLSHDVRRCRCGWRPRPGRARSAPCGPPRSTCCSLGDGLLVDPHPLDRDGLLVDDDPLLGEGHLVLLRGDVAAGHRLVAVGVGDRLALEAHLLVAHRDGRGDVLGDDVLAQPGPAGLAGLGADVELLLRAGHGRVGVRARGVVAGAGDTDRVAVARRCRRRCRSRRRRRRSSGRARPPRPR